MGKILVIAEKPSVARDIAGVLGCNKKGQGFLFSDDYIISWAIGHLVTLCEPEDYDKNLSKWKMDTLPIKPEKIKLKAVKQTEQQLKILKELMKSEEVDSLICATDSGREGELIFRYIYELVKCKKPFKRLWISSMTEQAIKTGFNSLKDSSYYDNLYESARCRSHADWLVGINATRAYTVTYGALLSIGRVQTPTLAIIVRRQLEINSFVPDKYWEIIAGFVGYTGKWFDKENKEIQYDTKLKDKEKADNIAEKVKGQLGFIKDIIKEQKKQLPYQLYDLTDLQKDANNKFGFTADKTLSIAQDLYEKRKMITYPRTDSRYLPEDYVDKLPQTINNLNIPPYEKFVAQINGLPILPITSRLVDNAKITDHHAIIPTEIKPDFSKLSVDERKIYDLIIRRFLAAFLPNYIYDVTTVIIEAAEELFVSKGTTIVQLGFMELYKGLQDTDEENVPKKKKGKDDENESIDLPELAINDATVVQFVDVKEKKTTPPKSYTEASLLSAMENAGRFVEDEALKEQLKESGLGTPATRSGVIERLITVGYISRKGKSLIPSDKAIKLIAIIPEQLKSPETTGKWEKGLNSIYKGTMVSDKFMESIGRYVSFIVNSAKSRDSSIVFEADPKRGKGKSSAKSFGACPVCKKGQIFENSKAFFCGEWKTGCKFKLWKSDIKIENTEDTKNEVSIDTMEYKKKLELIKNTLSVKYPT